MADLVSLDDFKTFLGGIEGDSQDDLLQSLLDDVEELFEAECNRRDRPFQAGRRIRCELHDGTGSARLFTHYPIARLRTITIGADPDDPDESLDPDDVTVIAWTPHRSRIVRVDGGVWSRQGTPNVIRLAYDSGDDLPGLARTPIKRVAGAAYRSLGAEGLTAERTSTFSRDFAAIADADPFWQRAVATCRVLRV